MYKKTNIKKHKKETEAIKLKGKLRKKQQTKTKKKKEKSTLIKMENKQNYSDDKSKAE